MLSLFLLAVSMGSYLLSGDILDDGDYFFCEALGCWGVTVVGTHGFTGRAR